MWEASDPCLYLRATHDGRVMGYGGNGITFSRLAAEIVVTEIGGGTHRDARLFAGSEE